MTFNCDINNKENINEGNFYKRFNNFINLIKDFNALNISDNNNQKENKAIEIKEKNSTSQKKYKGEIYYSVSSCFPLNSETKDEKVKIPKLNIDFSIENVNSFFIDKISKNLLLKYGTSYFDYNSSLENILLKISKNKVKLNPIIRMKMVNCILDVISSTNCTVDTFFLSVNIMDFFLFKAKNIILNNEYFYLIGISSMLIAGKFQEVYPSNLIKKLFLNDIPYFSWKNIKKAEIEILSIIGIENIISTTVYDFIKILTYDFYENNKKFFKDDDKTIFDMIKNTTKYFSILMMHYDFFNDYLKSIQAISCIFASIDFVGKKIKEKFNEQRQKFYSDWLLFLEKEMKFNITEIKYIAGKIIEFYDFYQKEQNIPQTLNQLVSLNYLNDE